MLKRFRMFVLVLVLAGLVLVLGAYATFAHVNTLTYSHVDGMATHGAVASHTGPGSKGQEISANLEFAGELIRTGNNELLIKLHNEHDEPVAGARVSVIAEKYSAADMSSHHSADTSSSADGHGHSEANPSGHAEMNVSSHDETKTGSDSTAHAGGHSDVKTVQLKASQETGAYRGMVSFPAPGEWRLMVNYTVEEHEKEVPFVVSVVRGTPDGNILGGFLALNVTVILAAGVLKVKSAKEKSAQVLKGQVLKGMEIA